MPELVTTRMRITDMAEVKETTEEIINIKGIQILTRNNRIIIDINILLNRNGKILNSGISRGSEGTMMTVGVKQGEKGGVILSQTQIVRLLGEGRQIRRKILKTKLNQILNCQEN